jgi:hypothetical protein
MKAKDPWEVKNLSYQEWGNMDFDWNNHAKVHKWIPAYFFRYNNYKKGLENEHIIKSTFGMKHEQHIQKEIQRWFSICVGAYSVIELETKPKQP